MAAACLQNKITGSRCRGSERLRQHRMPRRHFGIAKRSSLEIASVATPGTVTSAGSVRTCRICSRSSRLIQKRPARSASSPTCRPRLGMAAWLRSSTGPARISSWRDGPLSRRRLSAPMIRFAERCTWPLVGGRLSLAIEGPALTEPQRSAVSCVPWQKDGDDNALPSCEDVRVCRRTGSPRPS
jgi:hypothetical protein